MSETEHASAPTELSLDEAIRYAIELHRNRQLDGAETLYRRILGVAPEQPDALHFLGLLQFQRGRPDQAVALIGKAIEVQPGYPDFHSNLGNVYTALGRVEEAADSYARALALDPRAGRLPQQPGRAVPRHRHGGRGRSRVPPRYRTRPRISAPTTTWASSTLLRATSRRRWSITAAPSP